MPALRVFVSSTCYDLRVVRAELREYLISLGYEPVMSDFGDISYDPKKHTYNACLDEIESCDFLIYLVGSRFGGKFDRDNSYSEKEKPGEKLLSITQEEVKRARLLNKYIYTFVQSDVYHDFYVYKCNFENKYDVEYPSISNQETASYIFQFLKEIENEPSNNALFSFDLVADIKEQLTKQWARLFKELIDTRSEYVEKDDIKIKIESLEDLIIKSVGEEKKKDVQIFSQFSSLISFCFKINNTRYRASLLNSDSWKMLFDELGVLAIKKWREYEVRSYFYFQMRNNFFRCNYPESYISEIKLSWKSFQKHSKKEKEKIIAVFSKEDLEKSHYALDNQKGQLHEGIDISELFLEE